MSIAVVCTTLNEEESIAALLTALSRQTRLPDEVVVVDGGSTDTTVERARSFQNRISGLRIIKAPGTNISQGRNRGIAATECADIVLTDAGCIPEPTWLEAMLSRLKAAPQPAFVNGVTVPDAKTHLESCIARCSLSFRISLGQARFLPTARAMAFHRELWSSVDGFPEDMDYGEDAAFVLSVRSHGASISVAEDARVQWRPRSTYPSMVQQYFHYADGLAKGGLSGVFHRRTIAYDLGGMLCVVSGLLWNHPLPWIVLFLVVVLYGLRKAKEGCFEVPTWKTYYRVPLVLLAIHAGTVAGIARGNVMRLLCTNKPDAGAS
jgi:glycosyltransferase involved in cell wall biosynthesis